MTDLLDLLDWTDAPEWVVLGFNPGMLCGLCGRKTSMNQGGSDVGPVCDDCAMIDGCRIREHDVTTGRRKDRLIPGAEQCAWCSCGWWLDVHYWHDVGEWRDRTDEQIADAIAEHITPRHTSRWGMSHPIAQHDELVRAQAKRRRAYLAHHSTERGST